MSATQNLNIPIISTSMTHYYPAMGKNDIIAITGVLYCSESLDYTFFNPNQERKYGIKS